MSVQVGRKDHDRLFELSLDLLCIADLDGHFLDLNPAWERTLGWSLDELLSRPYVEFVHADDREATQRATERLRQGEDVVAFENRYRCKDGSHRWLVWNATATDERIYAVARDITRRKRYEQQLSRMATIVESSSDAILSIDTAARIRAWNPGAEELFGYAADEILGEPLEILIPDDRMQEARDLIDRLREGDVVQDFETERVARDGTSIPVSTTVSPIREEDGEITGFSAIVRDIRPRKEAEEELRYQKALLEATVESSIDGILVVGPDGRILGYNQRFQEMWSIPDEILRERSDEVAIKSVLDQIVDPEGFVRKIRHLYEHPEEKSRDEIRLKDGRILDRYSAPVPRPDDGSYGRVWFFRDVTDRERAKQDLERMARELHRSNEDLEQFASVASHDLQEPLRMVEGSVRELVEDHGDRLDGDAEELAGYALDGVRRMRRLIDDLLTYSRAGTDPRRRDVDVGEVLDEVLEDLSVRIEDTGAEIDAGELPTVRADPTQIRQLLQNLIGNALKFSGGDPPRIEIRAGRRDGAWEIRVADRGIGIDPADQRRIFGVFDRVDPGEGSAGTGIGLAVCRKIVERHGGEIEVDSTPGEGATFTFTIPVPEADDGG